MKAYAEDGWYGTQGGGGSRHDITNAVQVLYDIAHSSMDWGSGFLDNEEMATVIQLAITMGFKLPDLSGGGIDLALADRFPDHYEITDYTPSYAGATSRKVIKTKETGAVDR